VNIVGTLPTWAVGLLALLAGALLLIFNWGWLLAARAMLKVRRRKDGSSLDVPDRHRDVPT
jgi:hypothetical protein